MHVEVKRLSYFFEHQEIFQNLNMKFEEGTVNTILGPSGCGKSTFLNILAGLLVPKEGEVLFEETGFVGEFPIGYMTQKDLLLPFKTVFDNLLLMCLLQKEPLLEGKERVKEILKHFDLHHFQHYYPRALSGGLRQRVNLLRQLLVESPLLLLDEPFVALDIITKRGMGDMLFERIKEKKQTVVLVTHDIEEALIFSDQIIIFGHSPTTVSRTFHKKDEGFTEKEGVQILKVLEATYSRPFGNR